MKFHDPYAGILLKMERIKQDKGQKEVCHGICVASYLSKIERSQVKPDENILQQLFERLGITYHCDEDFIKSSGKKIAIYFENLLYGMKQTGYKELQEQKNLLDYCPLALDWLLIQAIEGEEAPLILLQELKDVMSEEQRAYYNMLQHFNNNNAKDVVDGYKIAHRILNNSYSLLNLMSAYLILGEYDKVNEYAVQCISLAMEEGNTYALANCYQLQGSAYACLNLDVLMLPFYKRCIHLLQNTYWSQELWLIYYNMGATYLCCKKYELAMEYLEKVGEKEGSFLLNHKKALVKIRSGYFDEAEEFLEAMKKWLVSEEKEHGGITEALAERLMYEEVLMEKEPGFLSNPGFIDLMERLVEAIKVQKHKGYYLFYRELIKEAYCCQRKYKKALELES